MKFIRYSFLFFLLMIVFISCKKDDPVNNFTNPVPFIQVGNKWVYDVSSFFYPYDSMSNQITANNNGVYTMSTWFNNAPGENAFLYYQNGYINQYDQGQSVGANQYLYKWQNAQVGDTWTRITPTETYTHTVESVNESVTVPAGTFICKKVHITFANAFNDQYTYWSDTDGIIKIENLLLDAELRSKNF